MQSIGESPPLIAQPMLSPEQRFSNRVEDYMRHRPGYPAVMLKVLRDEHDLGASSVVADIGSGTGISARPFLDLGCEVHGVEPNREMRIAAEKLLGDRRNFHSLAGSAAATGLADASVDFIIAAQAFHWFANEETRLEFSRILKPRGRVVLVWNERETDSTPFLRDYEALLLRHATDYAKVRHENIDHARLSGFFTGPFSSHSFPNRQFFDLDGLKGRLRSSSYVPAPGEVGHAKMMAEAERLFASHSHSGEVIFEYKTRMHVGR